MGIERQISHMYIYFVIVTHRLPQKPWFSLATVDLIWLVLHTVDIRLVYLWDKFLNIYSFYPISIDLLSRNFHWIEFLLITPQPFQTLPPDFRHCQKTPTFYVHVCSVVKLNCFMSVVLKLMILYNKWPFSFAITDGEDVLF